MPEHTPPTRAFSLPIEVFFSYSHADERLRDKLEIHLSALKREGLVEAWHDRQIGAGEEWKGQIDSHLNVAKIILLLISADFVASDYCYDIEVRRALERHSEATARVIPVILRPADWKHAPFADLAALPRDGRAVTTWTNRDAAFHDIAAGIRRAIAELRVGKPEALHPIGAQTAAVVGPVSVQPNSAENRFAPLEPTSAPLFHRLRRFGVWVAAAAIDCALLVVWLLLQLGVDRLAFTPTAREAVWSVQAFRVVFATFTFSPVLIYMIVDLRIIAIQARREVQQVRGVRMRNV